MVGLFLSLTASTSRVVPPRLLVEAERENGRKVLEATKGCRKGID
jgi:hypothetical protein